MERAEIHPSIEILKSPHTLLHNPYIVQTGTRKNLFSHCDVGFRENQSEVAAKQRLIREYGIDDFLAILLKLSLIFTLESFIVQNEYNSAASFVSQHRH